jgi:hypothetical protein
MCSTTSWPFRAFRAAARQAGDGRPQRGVGGELLGLVPPFRDPLLQRLDLGVEQRLQAGGADLVQRPHPRCDRPTGRRRGWREQQEQGEAGAVEGWIHGTQH